LATAEGAALGAALQGAWVDRLVGNEPGDLSKLLEGAVKLDEGSRAQPSATALEVYRPLYGRFKGLTQRLASGGFL
jgi:sugar (pentulose or hexulose) kinase